MIEVNSETDFVSKNDSFIAMANAAAKLVAEHNPADVAAMKPVSVTSADVPAELIEKERTVAAAKAAESGKPADIVAKMVEGSVQKYLKEVSLADQVSVAQMLKAANTNVKGFTLYVVGEGIEKKVDDFAAEVAAQVAAAKAGA
jgi:elongation factor Ts